MKKIIRSLFIMCLVIILSGCGNKKIITGEKFYNTFSKLNYAVNYVTSQTEDESIKEIITANNMKYQFEYFEFDSIDSAKKSFESNKKDFELISDNNKYVSKYNYEKFTQEGKSKYNILVRVDNTLIYCSANIEYKNEVKKDLGKIGY